MSGKQEKRNRRASGVSVQARRDQQQFMRLVDATFERRAARRRARAKAFRFGLAVFGLAAATALIGAGLAAVFS